MLLNRRCCPFRLATELVSRAAGEMVSISELASGLGTAFNSSAAWVLSQSRGC